MCNSLWELEAAKSGMTANEKRQRFFPRLDTESARAILVTFRTHTQPLNARLRASLHIFPPWMSGQNRAWALCRCGQASALDLKGTKFFCRIIRTADATPNLLRAAFSEAVHSMCARLSCKGQVGPRNGEIWINGSRFGTYNSGG